MKSWNFIGSLAYLELCKTFKMKYLLIVFLFAQSLHSQEIVLIAIDSSTKGSKDELFVKANAWLINSFTDGDAVVQFSDKDQGKIIGKGITDFPIKDGFGISVIDHDPIWFTITISLKDNRSRIVINDFIHKSGSRPHAVGYGSLDLEKPAGGWMYSKKLYNKMKDHARAEGEELIAGYLKHMASQSATITDEF